VKVLASRAVPYQERPKYKRISKKDAARFGWDDNLARKNLARTVEAGGEGENREEYQRSLP